MAAGSKDEFNQPGRRPALTPPQFSMATLLWVVAGLGALFGAMSAAGPLGGFFLLLLVLCILAHVLGNAIGSQLRTFGSAVVEDEQPTSTANRDESLAATEPASNLAHRSQVTRMMIIFTASGAAVLGICGGSLLIWLTWPHLNVPTAAVAVISPTVLGGLLGFTVCSFTQTASGAWLEAHSSHRRETTTITVPHAQSLDRV